MLGVFVVPFNCQVRIFSSQMSGLNYFSPFILGLDPMQDDPHDFFQCFAIPSEIFEKGYFGTQRELFVH